jgi:hypothetical protein
MAAQTFQAGQAPWETKAGGTLPTPAPEPIAPVAPKAYPAGQAPWEKVGAPPPPPADVPTDSNQADAGIWGNLIHGNIPAAAYDVARDITQVVDKPFLKFAALAPQAWNTFTGNKDAVAVGATEGYNFGDFFGKATPVMAGFKLTDPITQAASWYPIADTAGQAFEAASWFIGAGPEVAAGRAGVGAAAPGIIGKGVEAAKAVGSFFTKTPTAQFSTLQGLGQGFQALGKGQTPGEATMTGVVSGLLSAAGMKLLDKVGNIASGAFWKSSLRTQAGQFFAKQLDTLGAELEKVITPEARAKIATTFKETYNVVQEKVNNALTSYLGGLKNQVKVPTAEEWIPGILRQIGKGVSETRNEIQTGFNEVFGSNTMIMAADSTRAAYDKAVADVVRMRETIAQAGADVTEEIAPSIGMALGKYLGIIRNTILEPVANGEGFNMSKLNDLQNFIEVNGTKAEQAIAQSIRTALYSDVEHALKNTMGPSGEVLYTKWNVFKEAYRKLGNTIDSKFTSLWDKMNTPTTLANEFLKGGILKDSTQMQELQSLIGVDGIGTLRSTIMHTALGNAVTRFAEEVRLGVPETYDAARRAAFDELQKYISVAEQSGLRGFDSLSKSQTQWLKDAQTLIMNTDAAKMATELTGEVEKKAIAAGSDVLERARTVFEAAKTPTKFAESITKMTSLEDVKAALSFLKSPEDKAFVGFNIIKDALTKFTSALSKRASPEEWTKVIDSISSIGGADKKLIFDEIFGKSEATTNMVESIDTAARALKALGDNPSSSKLRAAGQAVIGVLFYTAGHPIMASGFAAKSLKELTAKESATFQEYFGKSETELYKQMEEKGQLTVSGLQSVMRKFGSLLKGRFGQFLQKVVGQKAAEATGDIIAPAPQP